MLPAIFSPRKYYSLECKNTFCNTESHSKTTTKSTGKSKCPYKNNKKEQQNSARSRTQSFWCHLVQELTIKLPVQTCTFLLEKGSNFRGRTF